MPDLNFWITSEEPRIKATILVPRVKLSLVIVAELWSDRRGKCRFDLTYARAMPRPWVGPMNLTR